MENAIAGVKQRNVKVSYRNVSNSGHEKRVHPLQTYSLLDFTNEKRRGLQFLPKITP